MRSWGLQFRRPEPRGPGSHGSHAPMGEEKSHRKPWTSCPSYPPCGFRWLWPHRGLSRDPSKPGVICDLAPGRPPGTLLWTQGHMEGDTFHPTCPLAYQTLGRLPGLALSSRHRQATIVNCLQLCHNLSSPPQASIPHTTTFNLQPTATTRHLSRNLSLLSPKSPRPPPPDVELSVSSQDTHLPTCGRA